VTSIFEGARARKVLTRISRTQAPNLANHLAARSFVLPHQIAADMPWSSSASGNESITQSPAPEFVISGLIPRRKAARRCLE
jgi:hypothetical protein